jgi:hypothetical protein
MTGAVSDSVYLGGGEESSGTPAIVGAVVAGLVLLTLVSIIITLYLRRGSDQWAKKQVNRKIQNVVFFLFLVIKD